MRIWYVGLERYESRYTLQLTDWTTVELKRLGVETVNVGGSRLIPTHQKIEIGQALDAHGRPYFAMSQIIWLIERLYNGEIHSSDWIYFEDMFHPGIESLFYILDQIPENKRPFIGMKNQANTIDPDDFTNYLGMAPWMREYEQMVINGIDCLFVNSPEMVNFAVAAGWREKVDIAVVGHYINLGMVRNLLGEKPMPWSERQDRVVFASRLVHEKQPEIFLELSRKVWEDKMFSHVHFEILSGVPMASSPYFDSIMIWHDANHHRTSIRQNLTKVEYYRALNQSKVMFNCALQDWVSYVLLEASALGMNTLFPAYRSFPHALNSNPNLLYIPWSLDDAANKLKKLLKFYYEASAFPSEDNSHAVERMVSVMSSYVLYPKTTPKYVLPKTTKHLPGDAYDIHD